MVSYANVVVWFSTTGGTSQVIFTGGQVLIGVGANQRQAVWPAPTELGKLQQQWDDNTMGAHLPLNTKCWVFENDGTTLVVGEVTLA